MQRRDDDAQVGGHRLLLGDELNGHLIDLVADGVDEVVGLDDAFGEGEVGVEQRRRRPRHRGSDEPGHLDQPVGDPVEVLVERVAHGVLLG